MADAGLLAQATRGPFIKSSHLGHAVIARADGSIVESWGNPDELVFARSSAKMIQALPLVESGAGAGLTVEQQALACYRQAKLPRLHYHYPPSDSLDTLSYQSH